jgi:two-component system, cell cycle response regulator
VARLGGDEFVIMLWHITSPDDAPTVVLKVIQAVTQPYVLNGQTVRVTTSAGIGVYPIHGEDADTLMKCADLAMYEAKHAGKNAYRIAGPVSASAQSR